MKLKVISAPEVAYLLRRELGPTRNWDDTLADMRRELRNHSTHTVADDELNHIVRDRLRDLTRRFRKKLEAKN